MTSQTLIDKFCNECNKRMVNDEMYEPLTPTVKSHNGDIFHVGKYLEKAVQHWQNEAIISILEYSEEYGFIERIFAGKKTKTKPFRWQEIAVLSEKLNCTVSRNCYYRDWGMSQGLYVYGYDGRAYHSYSSWYYYHYDYMDSFLESQLESKHFNTRTEMFSMEDIAVMDPSIKYCAWVKGSGVRFMDYVKLYRQYPIGEMLMKLGLYRMIKEKPMKKIQNDKAFQKWLFKHAEEVHGMAYTTAFNAYRKQPEGDARDYQRSLNYRIECGKKLADADKTLTRRLYRYATPEKICEYLSKYGIGARPYMDYIRAADWLQLDFSDTKVIFPRNFNEVHDSYTEQYGRHLAEQEIIRETVAAKKNARVLNTLNRRILSTSEKFAYCAWTSGDYVAVLATCKQDLINEGAMQNNCVGRMEYDKRMAEGKSFICFIRNKENFNESFITAEVDCKTLTVKQFYMKGNNVASDEMQEWKKEWEKEMKKRRKKKEKEELKVAA